MLTPADPVERIGKPVARRGIGKSWCVALNTGLGDV
jgi:hypothetical protein